MSEVQNTPWAEPQGFKSANPRLRGHKNNTPQHSFFARVGGRLLYYSPGVQPRVCLLLLLLSLSLPIQARPKVLVIIADHLTLADVSRADTPNLARLRQEGEMALMSPGLAHGSDPVSNVYATLGAGDSIQVGGISQGRLGDALESVHIRTALIGDADGDDTGVYRPALLMLPHPDFVADGTIPDVTVPGGKREDPTRLWAVTQSALITCDLVVVHFGDFARTERENQRGFLLPTAYQAHRRRALMTLDSYLERVLDGFHLTSYDTSSVFVVVPTPPLLSTGCWNQLTPFLRYDILPPGILTESGPGTSLLSNTTQTPGLIAARDIAPTILTALNVPLPIQMTGAPARYAPKANLERIERLTRLNQQVQNPFFWILGFSGAAIVFLGLGLYLTGRMTNQTQRTARYGLRLLSAWPLALLFAPLLNPQIYGAYLGEMGFLIVLLALLPSPQVIFSLTAIVLVIDGLLGTQLISQSALSEYALSGIRFYGIGNEYMGVLIGGALLLASFPKIGGRGTILLFAIVTFVLSFPSFGAKAGGAVTALATFSVAYQLLAGKTVTWKYRVGGIASGFVLILVWTTLGHWLTLRHTHIDSAVDALGNHRFGYILGIAVRKTELAGRVLLHPGTLLGLLAFAIMGLAGRLFLRRQVTDYLANNPRFSAVWAAGLWGCLVCLLFNDSGVVAAILLLACLVLSLLHGLFGEDRCGSLPSMSATSESVSPSATH